MLQRSFQQDVNLTQLNYVINRLSDDQLRRFEEGQKKAKFALISPDYFKHPKVALEIGAGTGWMILSLAKQNPDTFYVAVERDKARGNRLVHRAQKSGLKNIAGFRSNAIPNIIHQVPDHSLDRIYLMYPCPFPKSSQSKNRWYLHPAMRHLVRALKPGGLIVWASDQKFYIDEAHAVCKEVHGLTVLAYGDLKPNAWNHLHDFPAGRTKFEQHFLSCGLPCYELIVQKSTT